MVGKHKSMSGFTLVEVLVALVVMSMMAALTWKGVDGMVKASTEYRSRADDVAAIQTALLQWRTDLDHMVITSPAQQAANNLSAVKAIDFDSRVLRITRRYAGDEMRVVAWGSRRVETATGTTRRLMRWVSEPIRTRGQWQAAWDQAGRWGQNPTDAERAKETTVFLIDAWEIFYYRENAWSNPLSAGAGSGQNSVNPDGVRLILQLSPGQQPGGKLTLDWVLPTRSNASR